jgi:hypothetical protein
MSKRRELFLRTLITPGSSYIVSCLLADHQRPHKWSETSFFALQDFQREASRMMISDARQQRIDAIDELSRLLTQDDFGRAQAEMNLVTRLVEITERKNTDLHLREELLFGDETRAAQAAESLGLTWMEHASDQQSRQSIVARVLVELEEDDSLRILNESRLSRSTVRAGV